MQENITLIENYYYSKILYSIVMSLSSNSDGYNYLDVLKK